MAVHVSLIWKCVIILIVCMGVNSKHELHLDVCKNTRPAWMGENTSWKTQGSFVIEAMGCDTADCVNLGTVEQSHHHAGNRTRKKGPLLTPR